MLPEHNKNSLNGRNNQGNTKITLDPIEKLSTSQDNIKTTTTTTTTPTPIINFQTITNDHHHLDSDSDNHITTLGGSTPKKNHFTIKKTNRTITKPLSFSGSLSSSVNRKKLRQRFRNHSRRTTSACLSFQDNLTENQYRRGRRLNGIQLPLHPLQIFGWIILILFGLASFILLIPTFIVEIQQPLYGLLAGLYIVHTVSHLAALLIDPADRELRRVHHNDRIVPEFDRTKHSHVIENGRCHLCNIRTTSNRTKHCSVCNKCVGKFDHHCKWLNHCIGGRNYVAFLMCVVSAVIATLVILAAAIAQIILFYVHPEWLNLWYLTTNGHLNNDSIKIEIVNETFKQNNIDEIQQTVTTLLLNDSLISTTPNDILTSLIDDTLGIFTNQTLDDDENINGISNLTSIIAEAIVTEITNGSNGTQEQHDQIPIVTAKTTDAAGGGGGGIGLHDTIFLIFTGVLGVLAAITAGLLLHLCFFHIYISFLGLTTYEYIRNHRQNAAAANLPATAPPATATTTINYTNQMMEPSKLTNKRNSQIYICSSLNHPNNIAHLNVTNSELNGRPTTLHCCENSREYHQQTSLKTIYMCSLLEESTSTTTTTTTSSDHYHHHHHHHHANGSVDSQSPRVEAINDTSKSFHCCSQFQKNPLKSDDLVDGAMQRRRAAAAAILHFSEQCTFCTFRVKTPIKSETMSMQDKRCCLKTITKHHRWRRKWNCCSTTPDSPDVPNDIISSISTIPTNNISNTIMYQKQQYHNRNNGSMLDNNPTQIPAHFIKTRNINDDTNQQQSLPRIGLKASRPKLVRPWPVTRFRHMLRMIGRYRRPRCRHSGNGGNGNGNVVGGNVVGGIGGIYPPNIGAVKQNQVRPIPSNNNQHHQHQHYHQSSSSGDSDSASIGSDTTTQSIETILPTSVIRDGNIYVPGELTMPVLPPPTRKKLPNPTNLDELAETLGFSHTPTTTSVQQQQQQQQHQRYLNTNTAYRRQRRKNLLRTRSPTLSPIHESGLSNPTSPQPCRHVTSSCAATIVNNSCGTSGTSIIIPNDGSSSRRN